jgi:hypothetical protein
MQCMDLYAIYGSLCNIWIFMQCVDFYGTYEVFMRLVRCFESFCINVRN